MSWFGDLFRKKTLANAIQGGWTYVSEPFTGAWQRNIELKREDLLLFHAVFCMYFYNLTRHW